MTTPKYWRKASSLKTIDISAKEWFDKTYGNSYYSARVTVNFGLKNETTIYLPFQYGHGDSYYYHALEELARLGFAEDIFNKARDKKIQVRYNKRENCLKRDVKAFGIAY